ncbi:hypothetical protein C1X05_00460 [Laceyella sacchari]|uniref:Uncharacterized protein n=1 Tax=Laceyella tengchongensis TaxID=574699 RepID=A0AA45WRY3_9BACL|nr:hypothetical protein [Laceyella tengchongensis]AUS07478.1 hypothetical protein C1X05_00460 [Laceyella sacchari]SMP32726.1 hypothetical protein SAMN06265361_10938 [Laceyella tengchongensis]HWO76249.1 hypothetical protein [Bacillus sp. (in: firmicutes)]
MLKLQVEGNANQVQLFLMDLDRRPDLIVKKHENFIQGLQPEDKISVTCYVNRSPNPRRRMRIAQLLCRDGVEIQIPLLDVIEADMTNGIRLITGRSYDIFADKKKRAI